MIKFAEDILSEGNQREPDILPEGNVTGDEFEEWLRRVPQEQKSEEMKK